MHDTPEPSIDDQIALERERICSEYDRRSREVPSDLYAHWRADLNLILAERRFTAAKLLRKLDAFPMPDSRCLEIGFGSLGWLGELITWGVKETSLHGIELDDTRASIARAILPNADLRTGDATQIPWEDSCFDLVIASTVFTSILDSRARKMLADEITRVLTPGGALLWYDFKYNNPKNPHVRKVTKKELISLFPALHGAITSVTLAPPIARFIAPRSWTLATIFEAIPVLKTHLVGVMKK